MNCTCSLTFFSLCCCYILSEKKNMLLNYLRIYVERLCPISLHSIPLIFQEWCAFGFIWRRFLCFLLYQLFFSLSLYFTLIRMNFYDFFSRMDLLNTHVNLNAQWDIMSTYWAERVWCQFSPLLSISMLICW